MKEEKIIPLWKLGFIIILLWILSTIIIKYFFLDWSESATFGDTFGAINSLFSGLALAGIIYTIYLQKTELSLQRKELKYTREELKRTADAQESSNKMMTEQLRINNIPFLQFEFETDGYFEGTKSSFVISNNSDNPSFDIDIWIFITKDNNITPLKSFIRNEIKEDFLSLKVIDEVDLINKKWYFICDRENYRYFKKNGKIKFPIESLLGTESFQVFTQYRDVLGNNYFQIASFTSNFNTSNAPYINDILEPETPYVAKRYSLATYIENDNNLPQHIKRLIELKKSSITFNWLKLVDNFPHSKRWESI